MWINLFTNDLQRIYSTGKILFTPTQFNINSLIYQLNRLALGLRQNSKTFSTVDDDADMVRNAKISQMRSENMFDKYCDVKNLTNSMQF